MSVMEELITKEEKVVNLLMEKDYHIVFAESCTAGLAAARLVNVPNASSVLDVSFITYANEAKISLLGVKPETIESFGVVSREVAGEMAVGAAKKTPTRKKQIGVGISGIAGPTGGTPDKPVGTVSFGISIDGAEADTWITHFGNIGRNEVRKQSVEFIYDKLIEELKAL